MVLYELLQYPMSWPIRKIYARDAEDFKGWLEAMRNDPRVFELGELPMEEFQLEEVVEVECGEIWMAVSELIRVDKNGTPYTVQVDLAEDFKLVMSMQSVPFFRKWQEELTKVVKGDLYLVGVMDRLPCTYFVPEDIFRALKNYDFRRHEEQAEAYLADWEAEYKGFSGFVHAPQPTHHREI